jgi:carbon-monoxide dehydrogenase medium subunit
VKAAAFDYETAPDLAAASRAMLHGARPIAGGQSLGPMLNLRIAQPPSLIGLQKLSEIKGVSETASHIIIGAGVAHAQIEDGLTPDIGNRVLAKIAAGIAYRAVRNRGTIGGSLCHADPAADWVTTLTALGAAALIVGPAGARAVALRDFFTGAFRTILAQGEILRAVQVPKFTTGARFGYFKACRKPGEFAHAMAAVFEAPEARRVVIGAIGGTPLCLEGDAAAPQSIATALRAHAPAMDEIDRHMQLIAVKRAFERLQG